MLSSEHRDLVEKAVDRRHRHRRVGGDPRGKHRTHIMPARPSLTRKQVKQAEADRFLARVESALDDAHRAAADACAEFMRTVPRTSDGLVDDALGSGFVAVYKPSYQLRVALRALGALEGRDQGVWAVSDFERHVRSRSIGAYRATCEAACAVLNARLVAAGEFYPHCRMDREIRAYHAENPAAPRRHNQLARLMVDILTRDVEDRERASEERAVDAAASAMGKKRGPGRAASMTPERRAE